MKWAWEAHPGQDRRLPGVVIHSRLQRATSVRSRVGIVLEDGSGVAIDWVTGLSYSSAQKQLNVQSGQRKGRKGAAAPYPSVAVRDRGHWKGVAGSGWVRAAGRKRSRTDEKVLQSLSGEPVRSPKNIATSMTTMDQEICLILGQVSPSLLHLVTNLQTDVCGPGGDRSFCGRNSGRSWKKC